MSSVGFLIFDGLWREISARVSRFVRSASGRTAEKRRNLARLKMRGFLRLAAPLSHARTQLRRAAVDAGKADGPRTSASQDRQSQTNWPTECSGCQLRRFSSCCATQLWCGATCAKNAARGDGLARISHQTKCIGAANQRKVFLRETLTRMAGIPRCRQSVARRCLNLHPSRTGKWSRVSMEER